MNFLKKYWSTILITLVFIIGLGLLTYPTLANWWNTNLGWHSINSYEQAVENLSQEDYTAYLEAAELYNRSLMDDVGRFTPSDEDTHLYNSLLSVDESSVMGAVNIPTVKITLPIYHGTSEEALAAGAGHLEGSSLPIGGLGTHTVITGHRGLPSARLFTDLDQVIEGDYIILKVLNETLTYQVNTIRIVTPDQIDSLTIDSDKDQVTLVTCTPYGVNTHRMLITGQRVENLKEFQIIKEAGLVNTKLVALFIATVILVILFVWLMWPKRKKEGKEVDEDEE